MCKVNFVSEFNLFMRYARNNNLSMRERMLWIALFYIANDRAAFNEQSKDYDWPDDFIPVSNSELYLYCCLDKRAIEGLRNQLKQRGLIDFVPGLKNRRNPVYKINYLSVNVGYKNVPNDVPNSVPNHVPNHVPNSVPNSVPNLSPYPKYKESALENQRIGIQKKILDIDDHWWCSARARSATAQKVVDCITENEGFQTATPSTLFDLVLEALEAGIHPEKVVQLAAAYPGVDFSGRIAYEIGAIAERG